MKHLGKEVTNGEAYNEEIHLHCPGYLLNDRRAQQVVLQPEGLTKMKEKEGATTNIMA